jgi:HNH endonuclease
MAPRDRSRGRDVHIYSIKDPATVLCGLILTNGVTNANLYSMVEILVLFTSTFELHDENEAKIQRNDEPLQPGKYYIHTVGNFAINDEPWLVRTISQATGTRVQSFCHNVRERDRRCVVSGIRVPGAHVDDWTGFEAAHIFPLAYEDHWRNNGYDRWITIPLASGGSINSVQNGFLLDSAIHQLFDSYSFSINPDV